MVLWASDKSLSITSDTTVQYSFFSKCNTRFLYSASLQTQYSTVDTVYIAISLTCVNQQQKTNHIYTYFNRSIPSSSHSKGLGLLIEEFLQYIKYSVEWVFFLSTAILLNAGTTNCMSHAEVLFPISRLRLDKGFYLSL